MLLPDRCSAGKKSKNMALFKKFKLVPHKEESNGKAEPAKKDVDMLTKYLQNYKPTLRSMVNTYGGMLNALHGRTRGLTAKDRLNLLNSNRARLLHLRKEDTDSAQPTDNDDLAHANFKVEEEEPSSEVLAAAKLPVPKRHARNFLTLMKTASGVLEVGKLGELVIKNRVVPSTSFNDVMKALFVDSKQPLPKGVVEAVSELKRIGVSPSLLPAKRVKALFAELSQSGSGRRHRMNKQPKVLRKNKQRKVLRLY